jgi:hypothetical protein
MTMRIPRAQTSMLNDAAEDAFVERVGEHVRATFPALVADLSPEALYRRVRYGIARGRGHGFTWGSSLTGFVDLAFSVGPRFDEHPAFALALALAKLPIAEEDENGRIYAIYDLVTDTDWREAQIADEHGWAEALGEVE